MVLTFRVLDGQSFFWHRILRAVAESHPIPELLTCKMPIKEKHRAISEQYTFNR